MSNVYQIITDRIIDSLTKGVVPWRKPWKTETPKNLVSGKEYRGINVLLLGAAPFESAWWLTFNQAKSLGGSVRKGQKGTPVIFWKVTQEEDEQGKRSKDFILRYYTVFNVMQTEGIAIPKPSAPRNFDPIASCEEVVSSFLIPPTIEHGGSRACYIPSEDRVLMPSRQAFSSPEEYYSTLFHELAHSTGAAHRLGRRSVMDHSSFSSHAYSQEELVAECASAFLAAEAGISAKVIENSAAYIGHWIKVLRAEPRMMVHAAAQAAKAADMILDRMSKESEDSNEDRSAQAA
jgi:antirestriction protein ArdC